MDFIWLLDNAGAPLTGGAASTTLRIYRDADGYLFDFDDATFKASGWATPTAAFTEIDSTNFPGVYLKVIDVSGWDDGYYQAKSRFTGTPPQQGTQEFYLKDGQESKTTVGLIDAKTTNLPADPAAVGSAMTLDAEGVKRVITAMWGCDWELDEDTGIFTAYAEDGVTIVATGTIATLANVTTRTV